MEKFKGQGSGQMSATNSAAGTDVNQLPPSWTLQGVLFYLHIAYPETDGRMDFCEWMLAYVYFSIPDRI